MEPQKIAELIGWALKELGIDQNSSALFVLLLSVFLTLLVSVPAVVKIFSLFEGRSLAARQKKEMARIGRSMYLMRSASTLTGLDETEATALWVALQQVLSDARQSLATINGQIRSRTNNPDEQLSFIQRIFLLYRPIGLRGWIAQILGYVFLAFIPMALFGLGIDEASHFEVKQLVTALRSPDDYFGIGVIIFAYVLFNRWSLAERRWRILKVTGKAPNPPGRLAVAFLFLRPRNTRMFCAQLLWLIYLLLALSFMTMGSLSLAGLDPEELGRGLPIKFSLTTLGFALLAFVCRRWAQAELTYGGLPARVPLLSIFLPELDLSAIKHLSKPFFGYGLSIIWTVLVMTDAGGFVLSGQTLPHYLRAVFTSPVGLLVAFMTLIPLYASHRRASLYLAAYKETGQVIRVT